jgi:diguanylate cyclase (GGDEF)-like protein
MIYPDHLEEILEKLNQNALDQLLWEIGQRLPGYIRAEDIPCRFNESVFAIILPGADQFITRDRAEKIRREIEALKIEYGKFTLASTLSVGVANLPQNAHTAQGLMDEAYRALEQAAQEGGNRLVIAEIDYN